MRTRGPVLVTAASIVANARTPSTFPDVEGPKHPEELRLFGGTPYRDELVDRAKVRAGDLPDGRVHRVADHCGPGDDRRAEHRAEHDESRLARPADRVSERESPQHRPAHEDRDERE